MSIPVATQTNAQPNTRCSLVVRRSVIIATALFTTVSWMGSVSASCGNYLYRNGKPVSHHSMRMDELGPVSLDNSESGNTSSEDIPIEIPVHRCSGPNCSSYPLPLAPVPAAPSNLIKGFDQAAVLESLTQTQMIRGAIEIPESERGARFEPSSVFRPPAA